MHELAVTESIVNVCRERARGARVTRVTLEIGTLTCVLPESLEFCFEAAIADTNLAGAKLDIRRRPAISRCRLCGRTVEMQDILSSCQCGSVSLDRPAGGDQLRIVSMEIEEVA